MRCPLYLRHFSKILLISVQYFNTHCTGVYASCSRAGRRAEFTFTVSSAAAFVLGSQCFLRNTPEPKKPSPVNRKFFSHEHFIKYFARRPTDGQFQCPKKNGQYEDPVQCDKFYECKDGVATEKLCPDGLVFDPLNRKVNKCDQPFSVDCGERTELRKYTVIVYLPFIGFPQNNDDNNITLTFFSGPQKPRSPTICVRGVTDTLRIRTKKCATYSTTASKVTAQKSCAPTDCISMSTRARAPGPPLPAGLDATNRTTVRNIRYSFYNDHDHVGLRDWNPDLWRAVVAIKS